MVEMKNSLVRDLPDILSAFSKSWNLVFTYYRHFKGTDWTKFYTRRKSSLTWRRI